jgi:hypothetical protein
MRRNNPDRPLDVGHVPKDYRPIFAAAERQGFTVRRRPGGHFALHAPTGPGIVFVSSSPSDHGKQSSKRVIADLRRHGFIWPPP